MKLSLVIPSYNEEENVRPFYEAAKAVFDREGYSYEMIFVNDGSRDHTLKELRNLYREDRHHVSVVSFSRNFGKEAAILAGMKRSRGEYVALIDADLQQRPEIVRDMVDFLDSHEEYDCVAAYQEQRHESKLMTFFKKEFYRLINKTSDVRFVENASDFRCFRRNMAESIMDLPEYFRFSKGIFSWVGYETYYIPYEVQDRNAGTSKWSFWKLVKYAIEGFVSFTTFPLKIATFLGMIVSVLSIVYLVIVVIQKLCFSVDIPGYPTLVVLILFLGGMQLLILGIMGEYLARTYTEGKRRPIYIEKEVLISEGKDEDTVDKI